MVGDPACYDGSVDARTYVAELWPSAGTLLVAGPDARVVLTTASIAPLITAKAKFS